MKKHIEKKLNILKDKEDKEKLLGFNAIYTTLEKRGHRPQAIKRAIEEVINNKFRKYKDQL